MVMRDADSGELFVLIDDELADDDTPNGIARYRMTVAEELAHIHLHRPLIEAIQTPEDFRELHGHPQWNEIERNAKRLAAILLMPSPQLMEEARKVYHQIVGQPRIRQQLNQSAGAYTRWVPHIKKRLCIEMAKRFQVSEGAMNHRLGEWPAEVYKHIENALASGSEALL